MTGIEDVVRRSLANQVTHQPPMPNAAVRAIAGAAAARRRHAALTAGAAVVAVIATVGAILGLRQAGSGPAIPPATRPPSASPSGGASTSPTPSASTTLPSVGLGAVLNQHTLVLADGRQVSLALAGANGVARAYEIHDGWLVEGYGDSTVGSGTLWLFHDDGSARQLVDHETGVIVSSDGKRLAWRTANTVTVAHLDAADNVVPEATTTVDQGYPLMFAGSALVLGFTETGGGVDHWDVWVPQQGKFTPDWNASQSAGVTAVYTATPDGRWLIGQSYSSPAAGKKDTCLTRFDPLNRFKVMARACGVPQGGQWGILSPDGHWLVYPDTSGQTNGLIVVDPVTVFQQQRTAAVIGLASAPVWTGPDTVVAYADIEPGTPHYYRYQVGQPTVEEVGIPGTTPQTAVMLVPKLS